MAYVFVVTLALLVALIRYIHRPKHILYQVSCSAFHPVHSEKPSVITEWFA